MPITRDQFENAIDERISGWMKQIHAFLFRHKEQAYTLEELEKEHNVSHSSSEIRTAFRAALDELLERSMVDTRIVRGKHYYRVGNTSLSF